MFGLFAGFLRNLSGMSASSLFKDKKCATTSTVARKKREAMSGNKNSEAMFDVRLGEKTPPQKRVGFEMA